MLDYIYQWMENIAFYMVMVTVIMQLVSGTAYKKYIQFFAGMILILMISGPLLKIFGMEQFHSETYLRELERMEEIIGQ